MVNDDELIVQKILQGHNELFEELVKKYQTKIYHLVQRMTSSHEDALDVTQETFLQAFHSLEQFKNQSSFYTWLYRIASNKALDHIRKQKRITAQSNCLQDEQQRLGLVRHEKHSPEAALIRKEQHETVQMAIMQLPEIYRLTFILFHYQEASYQEIADILNVPVKTIATRIYRARAILKEKLLKGGLDYEMHGLQETNAGIS